jgi:hypothetical protein|nr:MAG TPA: hypothetical protein [Caudoviricetes sp.]
MKPTNETYELETLQDLLELHPDQLERWFEDFKLVHDFAYRQSNQPKTELHSGVLSRKVIIRKLTWTDDGKNEGTARVKRAGEPNA